MTFLLLYVTCTVLHNSCTKDKTNLRPVSKVTLLFPQMHLRDTKWPSSSPMLTRAICYEHWLITPWSHKLPMPKRSSYALSVSANYPSSRYMRVTKSFLKWCTADAAQPCSNSRRSCPAANCNARCVLRVTLWNGKNDRIYSLAPGGFSYSLKLVNFKLISMINILYFLQNCYQVNAATPHWSLVNIGSGNGLVPSGNKPVPGPMLN